MNPASECGLPSATFKPHTRPPTRTPALSKPVWLFPIPLGPAGLDLGQMAANYAWMMVVFGVGGNEAAQSRMAGALEALWTEYGRVFLEVSAGVPRGGLALGVGEG